MHLLPQLRRRHEGGTDMSGVYIKGMEMPTCCWACACYHHKVDDGYYDYDVCQASGTVFNDGYASVTGHKDRIDPFKARLKNCPLIPVPDHGRLIDADALAEHKFAGVEHEISINDGGACYRRGWNDAIEAVMENAETVIGG